MPRLEIVTIDGTVIEADQFKSQDKGLKLERKSESKSKPETIGFVPYDRMMYAIPEEVTHNVNEMEDLPA